MVVEQRGSFLRLLLAFAHVSHLLKMRSLHFVLFCLPFVLGSPVSHTARRRNEPAITIQNGAIQARTFDGVENFKGIPYAQPPTGNLRLRPPQPLNASFGTMESQLVPAACPQFWSRLDGSNIPEDIAGIVTNSELFKEITLQSEDCLTLNVQRPAGTTASASLPVVVWIFGGAFAIGATHLYDGSRIVKQSVDLDQPVIFVAMNYRLGGFGFLPGKEVSKDGSSNLGLRDQRLALQWVQDNIAAFGGDPAKVTLWGESAGAISILDHTIVDGGDISHGGGDLFRGAIMNSGSTTPTVPVDHPKAQAIYDAVVTAAGCAEQNDSLECLRRLPFEQLSDALSSVPSFFSYTSIDLSYLPRPDPADTFLPESPEVAIQGGRFAKVPVIVGDQNDEGTLFSLTQSNISTTEELIDYLTPIFPLATRDQINSLVAAYPDEALSGSVLNSFLKSSIYPQFNRLSTLLGDISFTFQRRSYLESIAQQVPTWSYNADYLQLPVLGTFHASDVLTTFFDVPPLLTTPSILTYYMSFINHEDPNKIPNTKKWPQYQAEGKQMLEFGAIGYKQITDDFREDSYAFFKDNQQSLRV